MDKLQSTILMIANEIKRICEKHDIHYYISGGTFLGAVRHRGFIPWDDDMDLCMKREDFERFIQICQSELDEDKYFLQYEGGGSEKYYAFEFAKIQLKGTKVIQRFCWNVPIQNGIFVDIFPLDNVPDQAIQRKLMKIQNHILKNLIWIKCGYGMATHRRKWWFWAGKMICKFFPLSWLRNWRYQIVTRYNSRNTKNRFISDYPEIDFIQNDWLLHTHMYEFENTEFMGYAEYDTYLTLSYGNYMELPPENKRKKHSEYPIDFGIYKDETKKL